MSRYDSIEESISADVAKFNDGWEALVSPDGDSCC